MALNLAVAVTVHRWTVAVTPLRALAACWGCRSPQVLTPKERREEGQAQVRLCSLLHLQRRASWVPWSLGRGAPTEQRPGVRVLGPRGLGQSCGARAPSRLRRGSRRAHRAGRRASPGRRGLAPVAPMALTDAAAMEGDGFAGMAPPAAHLCAACFSNIFLFCFLPVNTSPALSWLLLCFHACEDVLN